MTNNIAADLAAAASTDARALLMLKILHIAGATIDQSTLKAAMKASNPNTAGFIRGLGVSTPVRAVVLSHAHGSAAGFTPFHSAAVGSRSASEFTKAAGKKPHVSHGSGVQHISRTVTPRASRAAGSHAATQHVRRLVTSRKAPGPAHGRSTSTTVVLRAKGRGRGRP